MKVFSVCQRVFGSSSVLIKWTSQVRVLKLQVNETQHKAQLLCAQNTAGTNYPQLNFELTADPSPAGAEDPPTNNRLRSMWRFFGFLEGKEAKSGKTARRWRKESAGCKNYQLALKYSHTTSRDGFGADGLFKANRAHSPFITQCVSSPGCWQQQQNRLHGGLHSCIREETQLIENLAASLPKCPFRLGAVPVGFLAIILHPGPHRRKLWPFFQTSFSHHQRHRVSLLLPLSHCSQCLFK